MLACKGFSGNARIGFDFVYFDLRRVFVSLNMCSSELSQTQKFLEKEGGNKWFWWLSCAFRKWENMKSKFQRFRVAVAAYAKQKFQHEREKKRWKKKLLNSFEKVLKVLTPKMSKDVAVSKLCSSTTQLSLFQHATSQWSSSTKINTESKHNL